MTRIIEYPKTYNPHKRNGKYMVEDVWTSDELKYLSNIPFHWTEKLDGTNLRVIYTPVLQTVEVRGRTDNAQLHPDLIANTLKLFDIDLLNTLNFTSQVIFFGEGVGPGIQKNGAKYSNEKTFVGFDIYITPTYSKLNFTDAETGIETTYVPENEMNTKGFWLKPFDMNDVYRALNIPTAPVLASEFTVNEAISYVRTQPYGFMKNQDYVMEGLIGIPLQQLFNRYGERLKVKIKCEDYKTLS